MVKILTCNVTNVTELFLFKADTKDTKAESRNWRRICILKPVHTVAEK